MKLALIGDLHLTNKNPINRKDEDYLKTGLAKLKFCMDTARERGCDLILQAGDFFENPYVSNKVMAETIKAIGDNKIYCVYGQHDIIGHSEFSLETAPYAILGSCGLTHILTEKPLHISDVTVSGESTPVYLYGCSFGKDIPEVTTKGINILVIHKNVGINTLSEKIQTEHPKYFNEKVSAFRYVLVGDYHYGFVHGPKVCEILNSTDRRNYPMGISATYMFNMGCMMRRNKTDIKQCLKPSMGILDLVERSLEIINVPVPAVEDIFNLDSFEEVELPDEYESVTQALFETMDSEFADMDISKVFWNAVAKSKLKKPVINKLNIAVEKIGGLSNGQ